ncbi:HNH endonuclease [Chryseobacterium cucumeris]|uniref:HNH endonuclease n=1 Tax=Chryseobacterium cucumeris TaxID=1813611 RepID=UPI002455E6E7|nr:HNH endonuclease [Chryseobacterium cucumeris]MDH5034012.1 HNH endonuclease [Chryseobacterium cucumeris]
MSVQKIMELCYLCGVKMVDKKDYSKDKHNSELKFKHDEHIIQNALYGRLTAFNILCETCGNKLSKSIDTDFVKLFDLFTVPVAHMLASKDHGGKDSKILTGFIKNQTGENISIQLKDGKIVPKQPLYHYEKEINTVKIYGASKVLKSYKEHVLKELKDAGYDTSSMTVLLLDNINDYQELGIPFSEGIENFNTKLLLGLNKIATGFAASKGIRRLDMPCTIDLEKEEIIYTSNIVSFYPFGIFDLLIEPIRSVIEDEFPTHTLMLYTDESFGNTKLVCYIDLFSTFQFYVILNHNYEGSAINETYYQTIIKQEKPEIDIRGTRWKYINIVADDIGINQSELKGLSSEDVYDFLEKKYKQYTVQYTMNINDFIGKASTIISRSLALKGFSETLKNLGEAERGIVEAMPEPDEEDLISLYHEIQRIENESSDLFYRKNFITVDENRDFITMSTLMKMIELHHNKFSGLKTYGHSKFYFLHQFVTSHSKKKEDV